MSPRASKYLECCSHTVRPRDLRPGLQGKYALTTRVVYGARPSFIHVHRPKPVES